MNRQLPRKTQSTDMSEEDLNNMTKPITSKQIELIIKNFPTKRSLRPWLVGEVYQKCKELTPILHRLFQKTEEERTLPNSFSQASITMTPKKDKNITKNYRPISLRNIETKIIKILTSIKKNYTPWLSEIYPRNIRLTPTQENESM